MELQSIYYIVSIIFMIMAIALLLAILIIIWQAQRRIHEFRENIVNRALSFVKDKKVEFLGVVGMGILAFIGSRLKKIFKR